MLRDYIKEHFLFYDILNECTKSGDNEKACTKWMKEFYHLINDMEAKDYLIEMGYDEYEIENDSNYNNNLLYFWNIFIIIINALIVIFID